MKAGYIFIILVGVISSPFLYIYGYEPIAYAPPRVAPSECFSKATSSTIAPLVKKLVANGLTALTGDNRWYGNGPFVKGLDISESLPEVETINSNNGSVTCEATFTASGKGMITSSSSGYFTIFKTPAGDVYQTSGQLPEALAHKIRAGLPCYMGGCSNH
ncbi:MAG: hypothetical protein M1492_06965 [Gammaproteobacteria bacterium]|nr:hypothetical protein [Gammaproteobacteria bacterium]